MFCTPILDLSKSKQLQLTTVIGLRNTLSGMAAAGAMLMSHQIHLE
jgi:hypothetical protein